MGFLSRLFGSGSTETDYLTINPTGRFALEVVGESHYQDNFQTICGPRTTDGEDRIVDAQLFLEDDNPYDNQAVLVRIRSLSVGHLRGNDARDYRKALRDMGHPRAVVTCKARITGGWRRKGGKEGHYGVWLDIPT